ncbi:hypothetical protein [Erwinia sp. HR93]|uniref:hypothetical protein n=1 Tax=Erwinia sp. HR93 TaxID=3094840 RepID=UPI002ADEAF3E|nr:hypothetical protein [Erwinia sp. HR93]MEA1064936.1 hypothetical protein [Erwinia sp. HR93]
MKLSVRTLDEAARARVLQRITAIAEVQAAGFNAWITVASSHGGPMLMMLQRMRACARRRAGFLAKPV